MKWRRTGIRPVNLLRHLLVDHSKKPYPLLMPILLHARGDDLAVAHFFNDSKPSRSSILLVAMGHVDGYPLTTPNDGFSCYTQFLRNLSILKDLHRSEIIATYKSKKTERQRDVRVLELDQTS